MFHIYYLGKFSKKHKWIYFKLSWNSWCANLIFITARLLTLTSRRNIFQVYLFRTFVWFAWFAYRTILCMYNSMCDTLVLCHIFNLLRKWCKLTLNSNLIQCLMLAVIKEKSKRYITLLIIIIYYAVSSLKCNFIRILAKVWLVSVIFSMLLCWAIKAPLHSSQCLIA